jgi:hypothetical protein
MKRKNYKEKTPEPKDYGGSDYSDDHNPSLWAAAGRDDNDLYYWEEVTKEPTPKVPMVVSILMAVATETTVATRRRQSVWRAPMCCAACRHAISDLFASVDECFQAMEAMRQRMEDLECIVDDDYKFFNWNVGKLIGMVGNIKKH